MLAAEADQGIAAVSRPKRLAPYIALVVAVVMALLFWVLAGSKPGGTERTTSHLLGKAAPTVRSTTLDGQPFDLSRRKGSWVVINFFDSTCIPCRAEHPELIKFAEQQRSFGAEGAELYTFINRDNQAAVRRWFADNGGDWPVITDDDGHIGVTFGVAKVPETFIVDPAGTVVVYYGGAITADQLSAELQRMRDASAAATPTAVSTASVSTTGVAANG